MHDHEKRPVDKTLYLWAIIYIDPKSLRIPSHRDEDIST